MHCMHCTVSTVCSMPFIGCQDSTPQQHTQPDDLLTTAYWPYAPPLPNLAALQVAKSPICANHVFEYAITARGVEQLEGTDIPMAIQQSAIEVSIANDMAGDPWL